MLMLPTLQRPTPGVGATNGDILQSEQGTPMTVLLTIQVPGDDHGLPLTLRSPPVLPETHSDTNGRYSKVQACPLMTYQRLE